MRHHARALSLAAALSLASCACPGEPPAGRFALEAEVVTDRWSGLRWQRRSPTEGTPYPEAAALCQRLSLGGQTGWRLPSVKELLTLLDRDPTGTIAIDPSVFPDLGEQSAGWSYSWFWTATPHARFVETAWAVSFGYGSAQPSLRTQAMRVRCVR